MKHTRVFWPLTFLLLLLAGPGDAQHVLSTTAGETLFYAKAPAPATDVNAVNKKTRATVHTGTGVVRATINMKEFTLPKTLMQKHYNEKYMETDKYPTATFEGKIASLPDLSRDGTYPVSAAGSLEVHGVARKRTLDGRLVVKNGVITLQSEFDVKLADHNITIPVIFFMKITESVKVKATYILRQ